ncbi:MAG: T9SS type A sorting domain-containing protein [Bacteroidetes bacterium]|nr:T9SS type A sorting domain-containing protein [Bacteroidota bacterium]
MKPTLLILILSFFVQNVFQAQSGCTDPLAINFDQEASINDGTCEYENTIYHLQTIASMEAVLEECSGLAYSDTGLWGINDGGNTNDLFLIDTLSGEIIHKVQLTNAENKDWEDLAQDENFLYIGDFGNNAGNRTDLTIYKVNKSDLQDESTTAEIITFSYPDQYDFSYSPNSNNFDCEAFYVQNDSLHLFSKNWENQQTRHYVLTTDQGHHEAILKDSFNVEGLITGADISDEGIIFLLGYQPNGQGFMWLLFDYQENKPFSGNKRKIQLGEGIENGQIEGITFSDEHRGFICSEKIAFLQQRLFSFSISDWIVLPSSIQTQMEEKNCISVYPNPFQDSVTIETGMDCPVQKILITDAKGRTLKIISMPEEMLEKKISLYEFPPGTYYLKCFVNEKTVETKELIKFK